MKAEKLNIYPNRQTYCQRGEEKLKTANISPRNKELIEKYNLFNISTGKRGDDRRGKLNAELRIIAGWMQDLGLKDFDQLDKDDAIRLVAYINRLSRSAETRRDYRKGLKQFYTWFKEDDNRLYSESRKEQEQLRRFYHYIEKEMSGDTKVTQADPSTIITEADLDQVIDKGCNMLKEKAFLSLLHETGCRAAEFLNLRINDLKLKDSLLEIHVPDGKTGRRVIFATRSIPHILRYIECHPLKEDPNSFLWVSESSRHKNQPLIHIGGQKLINRCFVKAGLKKKHNWHWFRHSRATILAPKMNEAMLSKYMGWILGSRQIKRYCHLCTDQLEDVFLSIHGIQTKKEETEKPIKCICGTLNSQKDRYCYRCYKPLSVAVAIQDNDAELKVLTQQTMETMQFFMQMAKDPKLMQQFEHFKKAGGINNGN